MEGSDAELLAADGDVLSGQHGGVGGGLVTVGLDLHATGDTGDGLTATGITQVSLCTIFLKCQNARIFFQIRRPLDGCCSDVREIGDVDEGVVEGSEDAGNAEDELACELSRQQLFLAILAPTDGGRVSRIGRLQ